MLVLMASPTMIFSKRLVICIAFLFSLYRPSAILASETASARQAIGFGGGSAMGPGITYRHYQTSSFYQGQFFARDESTGRLSDFMLGMSYGKVISQITVVKAMPPTTLLFVTGVDGHYLKDRSVLNGVIEQPEVERSLHIGAGVSLDIGNTFSPGLVISLGTSYVLEWLRKDAQWEWNLGPQINVALLYNW